jgi:hypothetical protein
MRFRCWQAPVTELTAVLAVCDCWRPGASSSPTLARFAGRPWRSSLAQPGPADAAFSGHLLLGILDPAAARGARSVLLRPYQVGG